MAKKIRLDFSKVEERSGWNTKHITEGLHKMKVEGVDVTEAQDGTAMLVYALVPADPKLKTRRFPYYCKLQPNQLWKLRDLFVAAGLSIPKKAVQVDPAAPVGKVIAAEVEDDSGQYAGRSVVNGTYGLDILDDEDGDAGEPDEDEEEYEDEEADEAEDEEDEEEEDLDALSLPELRKRAKGLGIDTNGVKKPELIELILEEEAEASEEDDEDDLDDEDLEDEELEEEEFEDDEDEEEEPEPAPKRKAPARKAAAPAKRTVKRR